MTLQSSTWLLLIGLLSVCDCIPVTIATASDRQEVLIYYANETAPDEAEAKNHATFVSWLQSSDLTKAHAVADGLIQDAELFPQAVDTEIAAIRSQVVRSDSSMPVMIFTNRLARAGQCLVFDPRRDSDFRAVSITRSDSDNLIVASNPLSQCTMLWQAFVTASSKFDPQLYFFVLVTKSHGGPNLSLTVKLARRAQDVSREQVLQHLQAGTSDVPPAIIGTSKDEYLAVLKRAGKELGIRFPVVFVESCLGTFSETQARRLPKNVDMLFASGQRFLEYRTLDYEALLQAAGGSKSFSNSVREFLEPRYLSISHGDRNSTEILHWLWFAPLICWIVWLGIGRKKAGCWNNLREGAPIRACTLPREVTARLRWGGLSLPCLTAFLVFGFLMDSKSFATLTMQNLVDRIQEGDAAAQDELLRRVGDRLERLARKMLQSFPGVKRWEQTDDVLQNSLMRLLKALKAVRPENTRAFFGLATEQLRRQLLDLNRHYKGVLGHGSNLVDQPAAGNDKTTLPLLDPADRATGPDQIAELDRWQALHEAVETLPLEEREVFGLVFYHNWTQPQIAELLQVNERTVRRYWQSVCLRLNELLGGDLPD